jgi:predicted AAA+ superfamily ATPase
MESVWYKRFLENHTESVLKNGKVFVLYGPRRVGKTELIKKVGGFFQMINSGKHMTNRK